MHHLHLHLLHLHLLAKDHLLHLLEAGHATGSLHVHHVGWNQGIVALHPIARNDAIEVGSFSSA